MLALCCGLSLAACDGSGDGETAGEAETGTETEAGETGEPSVDAEAVAAAAIDYGSFEQINAVAAASQHGLADTVNIWVPSEYAGMYRSVDPGDPNATASFPAGALIVKEHLNANAEPVGLTIMFKGPAGYDAEHGDWWWANASLDGELNDQGAVGYCIGCHTPRADADWVFGVAPDLQG
ncbi:hypothetical protein DB30_08073 [Enhygromyxa salina]|uniref:Cytochrome P460 domain-containing protein n=1 Tax=Enhygromyxa salina TaxID=215803 RepID=A0A0C2CQH7_9BACT|nr:hypothetical protein DB30_08073 [Enhygromyxa salina]